MVLRVIPEDLKPCIVPEMPSSAAGGRAGTHAGQSAKMLFRGRAVLSAPKSRPAVMKRLPLRQRIFCHRGSFSLPVFREGTVQRALIARTVLQQPLKQIRCHRASSMSVSSAIEAEGRTSRPSGKNSLWDYFAMFCAKRIRMAAIWARVALAFGVSALPLPCMRPEPTAHCMASTAQPETPEASV